MYLCSERKFADQMCSYCTADLRLFFACAKIQFSHDSAHMFNNNRYDGKL